MNNLTGVGTTDRAAYRDEPHAAPEIPAGKPLVARRVGIEALGLVGSRHSATEDLIRTPVIQDRPMKAREALSDVGSIPTTSTTYGGAPVSTALTERAGGDEQATALTAQTNKRQRLQRPSACSRLTTADGRGGSPANTRQQKGEQSFNAGVVVARHDYEIGLTVTSKGPRLSVGPRSDNPARQLQFLTARCV